jgi:hypothetical protein
MHSIARHTLPLIIAAATAAGWASNPAPRFEDFRVAVQARTAFAKLRLLTAQDKEYRTELATAFREPVNFAGHHVLATIGCGASCILTAVIDTKTGTVAWLPFSTCCWPLAVSQPLDFRKDSKLLVLHGQRNEAGDAGPHYYQFVDGRFTELRRSPMAPSGAGQP